MAEKEFGRAPRISVPPTAYSPPLRDVQDEQGHDPYRNAYVKELYFGLPKFERRRTMRSIASTAVAETPRYAFTIREEEDLLPPRRKRARVCGLRRRIFYPLMTCGLLLLIGLVVGLTVGATAGRVVGSDTIGADSPLNPVPLPPSEMPSGEGSPSDPIPGSPIVAAATLSDPRSIGLYYQQADGAIQEIRYDSPAAGWKNSTTAFRGARKNTGLAAFDYLEGDEQNQLVIYIDSYDVIRGKRKSSATNQWEDLISLQNGRFIANGSRSDGGGLGAIGLAAVYSADFRSGPGARVFFHAQSDDEADASYVQELIWDQRRDAWSLGSRLRDPAPDSQLAVAVDDRTLRLFYCSGNRTLQESWMNLTDARQSYMRGTTRENILVADDSAITALKVEGSTLVYFNDVRAGIRELNITGSPNGVGQTATINPSTISTAHSEQALISLGAVTSPSAEGVQQVQVFYSDQLGLADYGASISVIAYATRRVSDPRWPSSAPVDSHNWLPLGGEVRRSPPPP